MPRVKRGTKARQRRKKIMRQAAGFYGRRKSTLRRGQEAVERAWKFSYRDRKVRKREFRALWIQRINAAAREHDLSYSQFVYGLKKAQIGLDRKMLSQLAIQDPKTFSDIVKKVRAAGPAGLPKHAA